MRFTCDGRTIDAHEGQSIAAALWAHGDRSLSRSLKFHRPRGWACGTGACGNCTMRVDGLPNIRTCITPATDGAVVEGQNAWPSVRHDLFRVNDLVFRRGLDHHRSFVRPRVLYPLFTRVMRAFAGWGTLPERVPDPPETRAARPDVLVVGGGPAGLAAATAAARHGAQTMLVDSGTQLGGHGTRMARALDDPDHDGKTTPVADLVARWIRQAHDAHVELHVATDLAAAYTNGLMIAQSKTTLWALRPRATVIATGGHAHEALFEGNDLPGVMSATGCQALLHRERVVPGRRAIVYGAGAHGLHVALDLHDAGLDVGIVAPTSVVGPTVFADAARDAALTIHTPATIVRAHGIGRVRAVTLDHDGRRARHACDLVVVALGEKTAPDLLQAMGAALTFDPARGGAVPTLRADLHTTVPGLFAAGTTTGAGTLKSARATGHLAGLAAARHAGRSGHPLDEALAAARAHLAALTRTGLAAADLAAHAGVPAPEVAA